MSITVSMHLSLSTSVKSFRKYSIHTGSWKSFRGSSQPKGTWCDYSHILRGRRGIELFSLLVEASSLYRSERSRLGKEQSDSCGLANCADNRLKGYLVSDPRWRVFFGAWIIVSLEKKKKKKDQTAEENIARARGPLSLLPLGCRGSGEIRFLLEATWQYIFLNNLIFPQNSFSINWSNFTFSSILQSVVF